MARAVIPHDLSGAVMLVDFGKTRTGIGIVYKGALLYTSTIEIGGDQLSSALRKVLDPNTPESELSLIKNTKGLVRGLESSEISDALISTVAVVRDELVTRMQYWHLRNSDPDRRINAVLLCGGSANLKGLPSYLSESLGVSTRRANVWENAFSLDTHVPPIDRFHSYGYATAIGLALRNAFQSV